MSALKEPKETVAKDRPNENRPVQTNGSRKPEAGEMARNVPFTPSLWATNPITMMRRFTDEMDHLFANFGFGHGLHMPSLFSRGRELLGRETGLVPAEWSPQIDVLERGGQFVVHADLPGMSKDDVKVEVTDDTLTIQGERHYENEEKRAGYFLNECSFGKFHRAIPLPEGVDTQKASVTFQNGVLEVAMPAPQHKESRSRRLEIKE